MPKGQNLLQLIYDLQKCPQCGYMARLGHINFCNGEVVLCDLCDGQVPIMRDYHSIYMHYKKVHGGRKGSLLHGLKQKRERRRSRQQQRQTRDGSRFITLNLILPNGTRTIFTKTVAEWDRLAAQPLGVFDTKDEDQFALMAAIATYKLEYGGK